MYYKYIFMYIFKLLELSALSVGRTDQRHGENERLVSLRKLYVRMNSSDKYKIRKEVHLDKETINGLSIIATEQNRSLKNLMENILIEASKKSFKTKKV